MHATISVVKMLLAVTFLQSAKCSSSGNHQQALQESLTTIALLDNVCEINKNKTLEEEFIKHVKSTYDYVQDESAFTRSRPLLEKRFERGEQFEVVPYDQHPFYPSYQYCQDRSAGEVWWCLHVWHPFADITACLNATTQYSTPAAKILGILNDLEYREDCISEQSRKGCLIIKYGRLIYDRSIVTMNIYNGTCRVFDWFQLQFKATGSTPPYLEYFSPREVYAEIGKNLTLECHFHTDSSTKFQFPGTWQINSSDLYALEEHPECVNNASYCYPNIVSSEMAQARKERIRSYQLVYEHTLDDEPENPCEPNNWKSELYLVIDKLQLSDIGNYTCYAETSNFKETRHTVHVIPIYPVHEPILMTHNQPLVTVSTGDDQFSLVCEFRAGYDTKVYWVLPNGDTPEIYWTNDRDDIDNLECYDCLNATNSVVAYNTVLNSDNYTMLFYRKLTVLLNESFSQSSLKYQCVAEYNSTGSATMYKTIETTVSIEPLGAVTTDNSNSATVSEPGPQDTTNAVTSTLTSTRSTIRVNPSPTVTSRNSIIDLESTNNSDNLILVIVPSLTVFVVLVVSIMIMAFVILAFAIYNRRHQSTDILDGRKKALFYRHGSYILEGSNKPSLSSVSPSGCAVNKLFNEMGNKEIDRQRIEFINIIDEGSFGKVVKALLHNGKNKEDDVVAIKMTKGSFYSQTNTSDIREELDVMLSIRHHRNIVNLIGHCTTPTGPVCVVMEFAPLGNLRDYLRSIAPSFPQFLPHSAPHNRVIMTNSGTSSASSCSSGHPLLPTRVPNHTPLSAQTSEVSNHSYVCYSSDVTTPTSQTTPTRGSMGTPNAELSPTQVQSWPHSVTTKQSFPDVDFENYACQIAEGLNHLQSMNVIHCDLASRNILIAKDFTLKIGDFGMAKVLGRNKEYHQRCRRDKIPVKWTAPEALESWKYTHKSDIWSYGIVLWEVVSFGGLPYSDIPNHSAWDVMIDYLKEGNRLLKPISCPQSLYKLMLKCWQLSPNERPTAKQVVEQFTNKHPMNKDPDQPV